MTDGTFESDRDEPEGLATGAGPTQPGGEPQLDQGDGPDHDNDIQEDIENKAEEANESTADQHIGDAMDDVDLEPKSS